MTRNMSEPQPGGSPEVAAGVRRRIVQVGVQVLVMAALLLGSSGDLGWVMAWVYLGMYLANIAVTAVFMFGRGPELIAERSRVGPDTKGWDRVIGTLVFFMSIIVLLVAGLDRRFGGSAGLSIGLQGAGAVVYGLGYAFASWAMLSNPFFSATVRIQVERGQEAVSTGPYRYVRHPGYTGWLFGNAAVPIMLGSVWALIPAGLMVALLLARTALEDRTLLQELEGYQGYARRVRFRLFPGIW